MAQKYHVVITNPPYLGMARFSVKLDRYVKDIYADVKNDLSMIMYKHAVKDIVEPLGYVAFITTSSWMFLASFEKLRRFQQSNTVFTSLVDFGTELFEGKVGHNPIVAWVSCKARMKYTMTAVRLVEYCYSRRNEKEPEYFNFPNRFYPEQSKFAQIPGSPIAYWVSTQLSMRFLLNCMGWQMNWMHQFWIKM